MKNYKYRLEALLKLRKLREHQQKMTLASINKEISQIDEAILKTQEDIKIAYESMNAVVEDGTSGELVRFYPQYIDAKREYIKQMLERRDVLKLQYQKEQRTLSEKRGEVKAVQSMKDKDIEKAKKVYQKKLAENIEDILQSQRAYKKSIGEI